MPRFRALAIVPNAAVWSKSGHWLGGTMTGKYLVSTSVLALALAGASLPARAVDFTAAAGDGGWSGFYAGVYGGAGAGVADLSAAFGPFSADFDGLGGEGLIGGALLGVNFQLTPRVVLGLQGDVGISNIATTLDLGPGAHFSGGQDWTASVSARIGYAASANTLLYAIGGYSHAQYSVDLGDIPPLPIPLPLFQTNQAYDGWHVGFGVETKLTPNLTGRVEYRYTQYGGEDWGTSGAGDIAPSTHTAMVALAWSPGFGGVAPPPLEDMGSWTGFYLGAFGGAGASVNELTIGCACTSLDGIGGEGLLGGGMIGWNHEVGSNIVVSLQGDVAAAGLDTTASATGLGGLVPGIDTVSASAGPEWTAAVSARLGIVAVPGTLLYAIGGYSHAHYVARASLLGLSASQDYGGWHGGVGIETKLTRNLTGRIEYRYTAYAGEDWGTGGLLDVAPSTHTGIIGLTWLLN